MKREKNNLGVWVDANGTGGEEWSASSSAPKTECMSRMHDGVVQPYERRCYSSTTVVGVGSLSFWGTYKGSFR